MYLHLICQDSFKKYCQDTR